MIVSMYSPPWPSYFLQDALALSIEMLRKIWKPDTYVYNGKKSYLHTITTPNRCLDKRERKNPSKIGTKSQSLFITILIPTRIVALSIGLNLNSIDCNMLQICSFVSKWASSLLPETDDQVQTYVILLFNMLHVKCWRKLFLWQKGNFLVLLCQM